MKRARTLKPVATNPIEDVTRPKVEREEIEYLKPSDAVKLLRTAAGTRLHAPMFLALATGIRRGELLALRWSDLDLDRGYLTVAQAIEQTRARLRFKLPKTKRNRWVIARAGVRPITLHGLRHSDFTNLLREDVYPKIASDRGGHASVAITMDIYSHAVPGLQEDAALRIDGAFRQLLESYGGKWVANRVVAPCPGSLTH